MSDDNKNNDIDEDESDEAAHLIEYPLIISLSVTSDLQTGSESSSFCSQKSHVLKTHLRMENWKWPHMVKVHNFIYFMKRMEPDVVDSLDKKRPKNPGPGIVASLATGEKVNEMAHAPISGELKSEMELLGSSDECVKDKEDEECNKRMIEEAHLDYIYTQHHKRQP
ncbi:putative phytosulfokines 6 [Senna tora]|uniref:Phytosulfokine n=1 Tax=Senna tora TaxID=362788 RepID=A0A834TBN5_9FABA|nr:putative phytosulfokines 6 [Senna tora]